MTRALLLAAAALLATSAPGCGEEESTPRDGPALPPRPDAQTCRFDGTRAEDLPRLDVVDTGGAVGAAVAWAAVDGLGERGGLAARSGGELVRLRDSDDASPEVVLDWSASVGGGHLFDVAVAPDFSARPYVYVAWTPAEDGATRVSRFSWPDVSGPIDESSELAVITLNPAGGRAPEVSLAFDPEGLLFIAVGDGSGVDEPGDDAQNPASLLGKVLRVDVEPLDTSGSYAIPADNPFADGQSGREEVWALGLHQPAGCRVFSLSGADEPAPDRALVCADRGGLGADEINVVRRGDNLGWPFVEGAGCRSESLPCDVDSFVGPIDSRVRDGAEPCGLSGGVMYRGDAHPPLASVYVYADTCSGRLLGARQHSNGAFQRRQVGHADAALRFLAETGDGELLVAREDGALGTVDMPPLGVPGTFPTTLEESGCYVNMKALETAPDLVPYDMRTPLWTDGAAKHRFLVLPPGTQIRVEPDGAFVYPLGSIILKTFLLEEHAGQAQTQKPVETRVMVLQPEGWEFHTYRWNDARTAAELLVEGETVDYELHEGGKKKVLSYLFPSRAGCRSCHGPGESLAVGPTLAQFNGERDYDGLVENQLVAMGEIGLFENLPPKSDWPSIVDPADIKAPLEDRARAYLHANCAHCHRPGGWTPPDLGLDLRYETPWAEAGACGVPARYGNAADEYDARIAPGDPDASAIWGRLTLEGDLRMPPLGTSVLDPETAVVRAWIESLEACP